MSLDKEYENIFSLVDMFRTKEKVSDFFNFFCQNTIRECSKNKKEQEKYHYPIIYSKEHETLSISFNFFIECIAKFYDPGNTETEEMIQHALEKVKEGRTTIVIAHRLSTIKNAHKIVVLENGIKVEEGKHRDLLAKNGVYANIYRSQIKLDTSSIE